MDRGIVLPVETPAPELRHQEEQKCCQSIVLYCALNVGAGVAMQNAAAALQNNMSMWTALGCGASVCFCGFTLVAVPCLFVACGPEQRRQ